MARRARLPLAALTPYLLDVPNPRKLPPAERATLEATAAPLEWRTLFGNDHPVEIEVGFGKGLFLTSASQARPATNFLGLEIERKYTLFTAGKLAKLGSANVKLAATEACWFLQRMVVAESVEALYVYFPDPWWKTRHHKRRLFTLEFASACAHVLRRGGRLHFASDVKAYFDETLTILAEQGRFVAGAEGSEAETESVQLTNFERKYRQEGRAIYRAEFVLGAS